MKKNIIIRRIIYLCLIIIAGSIQFSAGKIFNIGEAFPLFMLPLILCISMFENSIFAILFGAFSGLILDMFSITPDGYYSISFCLIAFIVSSLITFRFKRIFKSAILFSFITCFGWNIAYWAIFIYSKKFVGAEELLVIKYLATAFYTWALTPLFYYLIKYICKRTASVDKGVWS